MNTDILTQWLRAGFARCFGDDSADLSVVRAVATGNPEFGDYQCNAAMPLARQMKKAPVEIARAFVEEAGLHDCLERIVVAGPGFLNMYLKTEWLEHRVAEMGNDDRLGVPSLGTGSTVVMDYGGPNITKPLHIGHLRTHNIGGALDRMHRYLGYRVISDSHLGDWGTQFGITIMGYRAFGNPEAMSQRPMEELERVYVKSYERTRTDESWLAQCRKELVKLQNGDEENTELWEKFVSLSMREIEGVYKRLGVSFDLVRGESHYRNELAGTVELLERNGIATRSEGATVVFLEDEKLPVCIVRKSDGGFNYATTDLATVASRIREFHPDKIVYITDERQQVHFRQIFAICRKLGYGVGLDHVWFGLMRLPSGTFSTREGNVIKLEELLDEAEKRAMDIVEQSSPEMPKARQAEVARAVGMGAVKYADLSQNPQSVVTFTWEKAMALDGNSGPYLQYAYARIASVRDKYAERFPGADPDAFPVRIFEGVERDLTVKLTRFPETVVHATLEYKPSVLADYLFDLAQTYSSFYQNVPFLRAEEGIRESRVRLSGVVARILKKGLDLFGIETPERI